MSLKGSNSQAVKSQGHELPAAVQTKHPSCTGHKVAPQKDHESTSDISTDTSEDMPTRS